ncbi:HIT domain-containing protein [Pokkaliibacter sp. CJK22405]|uniref:HIT domain-containing protein n=1 Tax=Pokkaliibacter sp. CJK22405 TaxID=3384615 RepID=UPI00398522B7
MMSEAGFSLHPQLAKDTFVVGDLPLSRVLLMNNRHYPWLILVPRRADLREIHELDAADQQLWLKEHNLVSNEVMRMFPTEKLNFAAIGNMVPQLHLHYVSRNAADVQWPKPVWGGPAEAYEQEEAEARIALVQVALGLSGK